LQSKQLVAPSAGFEPKAEFPRQMFDFQKDVVRWGLRRGRAAFFEDCGLGKTAQELTWGFHVYAYTGENVLLLTPLAVADQTVRESVKFSIPCVKHCEDQSHVEPGISVTNYERLHRFDLSKFAGLILDESSILKSQDGHYRTKLIESAKHIPYRLAGTATPAPNDIMEIGNHAEFLGVMSRA
jgi:hypothetical protein